MYTCMYVYIYIYICIGAARQAAAGRSRAWQQAIACNSLI